MTHKEIESGKRPPVRQEVEVSSELANKLINAESVEVFLVEQTGASWGLVSTLKTEVDRLVACDLNLASRLVDRIEQLARLLNDPLSQAFAGASRARVLHSSGQYARADALYLSAIGAMLEAGLAKESAVIQTHRVYALTQMGRYDDALVEARGARRALGRAAARELAQLETNVGTIYYRRDDYKKALRYYDRADRILSASGDAATLAFVDFSRSNVFTDTDRPDEALLLLERAALAWEAAGRKLVAAQARFHIAYLQFQRGNYNTALNTYYRVREQLNELGARVLVAWCNQEIAEILLALNSFDDALETATAAESDFTELGMPYESAQALIVHALASMGLKQFDEARENLTSAREVFARSKNRMLVALVDSYRAELALRCKRPAEAATIAAASVRAFARPRIPSRLAQARALQARAAYLAGDLSKARRSARAALAIVENQFAPAVVYQCHHLLGRIARDSGKPDSALESFRLAVETIERLRGSVVADEFKATFLSDKISAYEDAIAACLDRAGEPLIEEAFRLVESSKSRALADLLARYVRGASDEPERMKSETRARLSKLIEDLNWYSSQAGLEDDKGNQRSAEAANRYRSAVARCERQIAQMFRRLEHEDVSFRQTGQVQAAATADLREIIEPAETLIEYFTTGDAVSAFIATRKGISVVRQLASKRKIGEALAALRFQIEKFNYGTSYVESYFSQLKRATDEHLAQIYKMVFAPVLARIQTEQLIIIPHGPLHYVPFHALYDGGRYLVERFEISYGPSASVLKLCCKRYKDLKSQTSNLNSSNGNQTRKDDLMVALGLIERGTPSIEKEIDWLAELFPGTIKLIGDRATRENLLQFAPRARFLHLASHGYFRRDNPMFSFLKLADAPLNFYGLLDLKLSAEMVTLSACHTGVNEIFPGDELHGLMRGFLYAGAPSLVASLWAVGDQSTAQFMREMYLHIRAGRTKREALRRAQLKIKDEHGHPYYWAPFVLMGSPA